MSFFSSSIIYIKFFISQGRKNQPVKQQEKSEQKVYAGVSKIGLFFSSDFPSARKSGGSAVESKPGFCYDNGGPAPSPRRRQRNRAVFAQASAGPKPISLCRSKRKRLL